MNKEPEAIPEVEDVNLVEDVDSSPAEDADASPVEGADESLLQGYITMGIVIVVAIVFVIFCIPILFS